MILTEVWRIIFVINFNTSSVNREKRPPYWLSERRPWDVRDLTNSTLIRVSNMLSRTVKKIRTIIQGIKWLTSVFKNRNYSRRFLTSWNQKISMSFKVNFTENRREFRKQISSGKWLACFVGISLGDDSGNHGQIHWQSLVSNDSKWKTIQHHSHIDG